ncbi:MULTISPECIES: hypothetical protein [unclassified Clostridium]|uniref:hypothetical protein n=1 Tax=unclassified Clostridium TaxID=2614128 RepID=UPI000297A5EB|nr:MULTISPECIES: hypothetical protein [unclassified Clostridium]EKQ56405.1 MAG: hypothetical protein A370_01997 [Clostridium sp. Maddingley MBC34-26]
MARKISISFKETEKDIKLYNFLNALDDKSADIKTVLRNFYKSQLNEKDIPVESYVKKANEEVDVLNF